MTNLESLEANKAAIIELWRDAVRAKIQQWDAEGDIENLIGEIDGADGALCDYAANCDSPEAVDKMFTDDEILKTVRGLMQAPDAPVFTPPEE
jgi:hypothetical protein